MSALPKLDRIRQYLQKEVEKGKPGDRLPSVRTMMAKYRVGQSFIERSVDELVRQSRVRRVRGSGIYITGAIPRSRTLGLYTDSEVAAHSNALFIEGARMIADAQGYQVADFGPRNIFESREDIVATLEGLGLAGIITAFSTASYFRLESDELLKSFQRLHVPIVTCLPIAAMPADAVMPDHFEAFEQLGKRLKLRIKTRVKFLGHLGIPSLARLHGLRVGLGPEIPVDPELLDNINHESVYERLLALIRSNWEGHLVVGVQPGSAGLIEALRDAPYRQGSPHELSITLEEGDLLPPGIIAHVVRRPSRKLGAAAAEMLLRRLNGYSGEPQRIIIKHEHVSRLS